ncbi:MAG: 3-oxoadipate enol-lactonase [Paracoccaceae bacterium]
MGMLRLGDITVHWRQDGAGDGPALVFSHPLGVDLTVWDAVIPLLPQGLRIVRYDTRGHGATTCPDGPYAMGALVRDAEMLLDALDIRDSVFVGMSMGGLIAQGLAVKRMDLVRGLVLSNTAARIGTVDVWAARIDAVRAGGMTGITDETMRRWFGRRGQDGARVSEVRALFESQRAEGYAGCAAAIAGADFLTPTSGLRLPALVIAGSEDGSTPPDMVRELHGLIPGARFALIRRAGHLPCIDAPETFAAEITDFLRGIGHG